MPGHAYAGINYPIEDVLYEVGGHEKHREQNGGAHDDREVLLEDRTHELLAEARYGEDRLDYQEPRYHGGGEGEQDGNERDHRVPEHVLEDDRQPAQTLGLGQRHEVGDGDAEHCQKRSSAIPETVLLEGAYDAEDQTHHQPYDDRLGPQKNGDGQPLQDDVGHGFPP